MNAKNRRWSISVKDANKACVQLARFYFTRKELENFTPGQQLESLNKKVCLQLQAIIHSFFYKKLYKACRSR